MPVLMVFADGIGLGSGDPAVNPLARPECTLLRDFLAGGVPLDCRLDTPGLPQSATGQTAIFSGINAAKMIGRHQEGFPGPDLRKIIRKSNIFSNLTNNGYSCAFANAYRSADPVRNRRQSVTTVMTLAALGMVRGLDRLRNGEAVYQDITNTTLAADGWNVPCMTPAEAADRLCRLAGGYDLTLFEYFRTDRAGHTGSMKTALTVLDQLQRFLDALTVCARRDRLTVVFFSDHGNIEDITVRTHTLNSVPLVVSGPGSGPFMQEAETITDIYKQVIALVRGKSRV